jgi:thiol-disulfide isomerase/thioredoxin
MVPMSRALRPGLRLALLLVLSVADARAQPATAAPLAPLDFVDVRFAHRSLDDFGPKAAFALYFVTIDCPLAPRYLPLLNELAAKYRERGVQFVAVDVGLRDTVVAMASFALDHRLDFPIVKDLDLAVAHALGATRAGEIALVDGRSGERRLRYRGRIDARYRAGGEGPAGRADLVTALDELLAGEEVSVPRTVAEGCLLSAPPPPRPGLTFGRDVAPIVARRCVGCHKSGGAAPFELASYQDAADHAAMIAEVVATGRMPPWHASESYGRFFNHLALDDDERSLLVDWARGERAAGDLSHLPPPPAPPQGRWRIGTPDVVLDTPTEMHLPADGVVPYQYTVLPAPFLEDTWVEAIEISPDNRRAMHHCDLAFVKFGEQFRQENFITGQVPGGDPMVMDPGTAILVPKGSLLGLQIHYVTTGREESDRIHVALRYPRTNVQRRMRHLDVANYRFAIPPGAENHPVSAVRTLDVDALAIGMVVHMHLRGRDMRFTATPPGADPRTLLLVASYDFNWQQSYRFFPGAERFPKGTRIECLAHFDNSRFNPFNPDPAATVTFGLQTDSEMHYGFFFYVDANEHLDLAVDPSNGHVIER